MKKQTISMIIVIMLLFTLFVTSCSSPTQPTTPTNTPTTVGTTSSSEDPQGSSYPDYLNLDSEFPIVKEGEKVTITITQVYNSALGGRTEDIWFWKFASEKMNITFDVEQIMDSAAPERKNLMFASGDLRDLILNMPITTSDLVTYGQGEKKLYDLNKLMTHELASNQISLHERFPSLRAAMSAPDGGMYTFPKIGLVNDPGSVQRLFINEEWLKAVNMEAPQTLDDFYNVLRAFKDMDPSGTGRIIPLGGNYQNFDPSIFVLSALGFINGGVASEPALRNGQVEIPAGSVLYKDYLAFMNKLYTEQLMDENFFTLDRTQAEAQLAEKLVGVMRFGAPYLVLPDISDFQKYKALAPITSQHNDQKVWAGPNSYIVGTAVMSSKANHPEVIMRFMDYIYSQEGGVYSWQGPPDHRPEDTLGMFEGWTITEGGAEIFPAVESGKYESAFHLIQALISPFPTTMGNRSDIMNDKRIVAGLEPLLEMEFDLTSGDRFYRWSVTQNLLPYAQEPYPNNVYFTEEENTRLSDLRTVITDFVAMETAKFITGANQLSNIDKYYNDLKTLGFEEYEGLYIKAYENYLNNKR